MRGDTWLVRYVPIFSKVPAPCLDVVVRLDGRCERFLFFNLVLGIRPLANCLTHRPSSCAGLSVHISVGPLFYRCVGSSLRLLTVDESGRLG